MAKFEIFKTKDDHFRFHLKADNGKVILTSEGYKAKASALNGIASVQTNGGDPDRYEVIESLDGQYYFHLKAANNEIIGVSERYTSFDGMNAGIASVEKYAPTAETVDRTL